MVSQSVWGALLARLSLLADGAQLAAVPGCWPKKADGVDEKRERYWLALLCKDMYPALGVTPWVTQ